MKQNTLNGVEIVATFNKKNLKKKTNQAESRNEKVIKKKVDKLYVKQKCYGNFFNTLINEKDMVYI